MEKYLLWKIWPADRNMSSFRWGRGPSICLTQSSNAINLFHRCLLLSYHSLSYVFFLANSSVIWAEVNTWAIKYYVNYIRLEHCHRHYHDHRDNDYRSSTTTSSTATSGSRRCALSASPKQQLQLSDSLPHLLFQEQVPHFFSKSKSGLGNLAAVADAAVNHIFSNKWLTQHSTCLNLFQLEFYSKLYFKW